MLPPTPAGWPTLGQERERPYFRKLEAFLDRERGRHTVHPPREETFRALELTPFQNVRVVLLGQDPYHGPGQAHGLAFSVRPGVPRPPSLRNLFRELHDDLGVPVRGHGTLTGWAREGVLLLNTILTVREGQPGSHAGAGWEAFTGAVLERVAMKRNRVVFLLLGRHARNRAAGLDLSRHAVVEAPHPSPLSARRGFFGSRIFSATNALLEAAGREPVDWDPGEAPAA
jgi:uracil-DNA glycosylase